MLYKNNGRLYAHNFQVRLGSYIECLYIILPNYEIKNV